MNMIFYQEKMLMSMSAKNYPLHDDVHWLHRLQQNTANQTSGPGKLIIWVILTNDIFDNETSFINWLDRSYLFHFETEPTYTCPDS